MRTIALTLLLTVLGAAVATAQDDAPKTGTLRLRCAPGIAIQIDGKPAGTSGRRGLKITGLAVGEHQLAATREGFHPQRAKFAIRAGRSTRLTLGSLVPKHQIAVADVNNTTIDPVSRRHPQPVSGGTLRVRVSGLPPMMSRWFQRAPTSNIALEINTYLYSPLILSDPDTLELLPFVARYWRSQDVLDLVTEGLEEDDQNPEKVKYERRYGIVGKVVEGKSVELQEGASWVTVGRHDATVEAGKVTLRGGRSFKVSGKPQEIGRYTLRFLDVTSAKPIVVPWKKIAKVSWALGFGKARKRQRGIRKNCRFTLHLRKGVTWHDGKPFTAHDIDFTFNRLQTTMRQLRARGGAAQRYDPFAWLRAVKATDAQTVRFDWSRPYFQSLAISGRMAVIPKHLYEQKGADTNTWWRGFTRNPDLRTPTGYGPYRFDKRTGSTIELARNDKFFARSLDLPYYDPDRPYMQRIHWVRIARPADALKALNAGTIDMMKGFEPKYWFDEAADSDTFRAACVRVKALQPVYTYIGWNLRRPFFKDKRVRHALAMLLPRKLIAQKVHRNLAFPVSGPFFYNSPAYDKTVKPHPSDHKRAIKLLAEAGFIDRDKDGWLDYLEGDKPKTFEIEYMIHDARDYHADIAQLVAETLKGAGVKVRIKKIQWRVFSTEVARRQFDAVRFAWRAAFDPDVYPMWHSSQGDTGSNYVKYSNPEVDRLLEQAQVTFDGAKRWAMLRKVHRILNDDEPYTFLFCFYTLAFYKNDLRGVKLYATNAYGPDLTEWWRQPAKRTGWLWDDGAAKKR